MDKREQILAAALREFSQNDYESASVNQIIKESHTSKGTFYHYFENKEALYLALLKEAWQKKMSFMQTAKGNTLFELLQSQVIAGIQFSRDNPDDYALSRRFANENNPRLFQLLLVEIAADEPSEKMDLKALIRSNESIFRADLPLDFIERLLILVLDNVNGLVDETDSLQAIEDKLLLTMSVLKKGLEG